MTRDSQKLIMGLKQMEGSQLFIVMEHIKQTYQLSEDQIFLTDIERILRETVLDYLDSCDNIKTEVRRLLDSGSIAGLDNSSILIFCRFLLNTQVRNNDGIYINGFDEEIVKCFEEHNGGY